MIRRWIARLPEGCWRNMPAGPPPRLQTAATPSPRWSASRWTWCDETGLIRVTMALSEALTLAMVRGNLEIESALRDQDEKAYQQRIDERRRQQPYRDRRIHVIAKELLHEARYIVRHEGPGFD